MSGRPYNALQPRGSCQRLVGILADLCAHEDEPEVALDRVLDWLAYPIQHPGAKMRTALLVCGPAGMGTSLFFRSIAHIYGRHGTWVTQRELDSPFNAWLADTRFVVVEEVESLPRQLNALVTERALMINEKNAPKRSESNHANFVVLANRARIFDRSEPHFHVLRAAIRRKAMDYQRVIDEIGAGGLDALHRALLARPLGGISAEVLA